MLPDRALLSVLLAAGCAFLVLRGRAGRIASHKTSLARKANGSSTATSSSSDAAAAADGDALESEQDSLDLPLLVYFSKVSGAFRQHFGDDAELAPIFKASFMEATVLTRVLSLSVDYRSRRLNEGRIPTTCEHGFSPGPDAKCDCFNTEDKQLMLSRKAPLALLSYESNHDILRRSLLGTGLSLISHREASALFRPSHFLAFSQEDKVVYIVVRGTSSLDDMQTNLFIEPETLMSSSHEIVHGGLLKAARWLLTLHKAILVDIFSRVAQYRIECIGHSLGAGVAAVLAALLKEELGIEKVQAYCFAPPPCLGAELAIKSKSYILSAVNGDDVIPRTGVSQIKATFLTLMRLKAMYDENQRSWAAVEQELDKQDWGEIETKATYFRDAHFDSFVPGVVIYALKTPATSGSPVLIKTDGLSPKLRFLTLSSSMLRDHAMDEYLRLYGEHALNPKPEEGEPTEEKAVSQLVPSAIEAWQGMQRDVVDALKRWQSESTKGAAWHQSVP